MAGKLIIKEKPELWIPRRELWRRLMMGSAGMAGVVLLTEEAYAADVPFLTWGFNATGSGTVARTQPNRISDFKNPLEYGADPTGAADSTSAWQTAINQAAAQGQGTLLGGLVQSPPGTFKISSELTNTNPNSTVSIVGAGKNATVLTGNVTGHIIHSGINTFKEIQTVKDLSCINTNTGGNSGGIRIELADTALLVNVYTKGVYSCSFGNNTFNSSAYNCTFEGPGASVSGSQALDVGQCGVYNCNILSAERGIGLWNGGGIIDGCNISLCTVGLDAGFSRPLGGGNNKVSGWSCTGNTFDRNTIGLRLASANTGEISSNRFIGATGPDLVTKPTHGIQMVNCSYLTLETNEITALCSVAGIDLSGSGSAGCYSNTVNIGAGGGAPWIMPTSFKTAWVFQGNNSPPFLLTVAELGSAVGQNGAVFNVSDSSVNTMGANVLSGGALQIRARSNNVNWTVCGK